MPDGEVRKFAVNLSRRESDPERIEENELQKLVAEYGSGLARKLDDLDLLNRSGDDGREFWQALLWATLALLFGELFLVRRLSTKAKGVQC